jgi:hypothetical protein
MDQHDYSAAWHAAFTLAAHVGSGNAIPPMPPTMMLHAGEVQHGVVSLSMMVYSGMDVEYNTGYVWGGGLILSSLSLAASAAKNASAKARAENLARPQWRSLGPAQVTVTSQRVALQRGATWSSLDLYSLANVQVDLAHWTIYPTFQGEDPILLQGPWAPWLAVVMSSVVSGNPWPPGMPAVALTPDGPPSAEPHPDRRALPSAEPPRTGGFR